MAKKICNQIGCHELIGMKDTYCTAHAKSKVRDRNHNYDKFRRNKEHDKFYHSKEWKQAKTASLERTGGLCEDCSDLDMIVKADVVDHIIPIEKNSSLKLDQSNLRPLCHAHHNKKTAEDLKR